MACAFVAAMLSGSALFVVSLFFEKSGAFERSYAFALMASALVWVFPILLDISSWAREIVVYACFAACIVAIKCVFGKSARGSILLSAAFALSQAAVFLMAYEKVIL